MAFIEGKNVKCSVKCFLFTLQAGVSNELSVRTSNRKEKDTVWGTLHCHRAQSHMGSHMESHTGILFVKASSTPRSHLPLVFASDWLEPQTTLVFQVGDAL